MKQCYRHHRRFSGFGRLSANALGQGRPYRLCVDAPAHGRNAAPSRRQSKNSPETTASTCVPSSSTSALRSRRRSHRQVVAEQGRLDVVMHNAGHMVFGPQKRSPPNSSQNSTTSMSSLPSRVYRAALPQLRKQGKDCLSGSPAAVRPAALLRTSRHIFRKGGHGCDGGGLLRAELARWGLETSTSCRVHFTGGTNHFAHSGRLSMWHGSRNMKRVPHTRLRCANPQRVRRDRAAGSRRLVRGGCDRQGVDAPFGKRPSACMFDPTEDGADVAFAVFDRVRMRCCIVSDFPTCSSRAIMAETFKAGAGATRRRLADYIPPSQLRIAALIFARDKYG